MLRMIFAALYFGLWSLMSLYFLLFYFLLGVLKERELQKAIVQKFSSLWSKNIFWSTGSRIKIFGLQNLPEDQNVLFVSNHQSFFDTPLLVASIPRIVGFIAKIEVTKIPIVNIWLRLLNCLMIDRKNLRQSLRVMQKGVEHLQRGDYLVIFPEGTRGYRGKMRKFKRGSMKLALESGVPVVPVTIDGTYKMLSDEKIELVPVEVKLHIHEPIEISELTEEEKKDLAGIIQKKIKGKLPK